MNEDIKARTDKAMIGDMRSDYMNKKHFMEYKQYQINKGRRKPFPSSCKLMNSVGTIIKLCKDNH